MPIINVKLVEGALSTDQKKALLSKLTDAVPPYTLAQSCKRHFISVRYDLGVRCKFGET